MKIEKEKVKFVILMLRRLRLLRLMFPLFRAIRNLSLDTWQPDALSACTLMPYLVILDR